MGLTKFVFGAALFISFAFVVALMLAGLLVYQDSKQTGEILVNTTQSNSNGVTLTFSEIAKHSTSSDCWIIISNKVYDVASYLPNHPGSAAVITPYCGQDATVAFATKGGKGSHSSFASGLLDSYYLGDVNQNVAANTGSNSNQQPTNSPPASSNLPVADINLGNILLNAAEVAKHSTSSNCWCIISDKVYDLTSYINSHPGGVSAITSYCGQDATVAFATKGGKGSHSSFASSLLNSYYIGDLNQQISASTVQQRVVNSTSSTIPRSHENEFEDD
jgi:cytochrome b involved in lipid metabolism